MSITFEQRVILTYLAANLRHETVVIKENERLTGRSRPETADPNTWIEWCAEAEGRRCAMQAEAFLKGVKAHEDKAWGSA